jgi:hypothetical protein
MRLLTILFLTLSLNLVGQSLTVGEIENYCEQVKLKLDKNELKKFTYPNMSECGGGLDGYYDNNNLVYIDATYGAEFGYVQRTYFLKDNEYYKITETRYLPADKVDNYCAKNKTKTGECDYKNMPYDNTITTIIFSRDKILTVSKNNKKIITTDTSRLLKELTDCGESMKKELGAEKISR